MSTDTPIRGHAKRQALAALPPPDLMDLDHLDAEIRALIAADKESARRWACSRPGCNGLPHPGWLHKHARASQRLPEGDWDTWLMLTGRGWGKTRTAAEGVRKWWEDSEKPLHIAVVGKKDTLTKAINFEHRKSGLLRVIPERYIKHYNRSIGDLYLELTNGTILRGFGANQPNNIRGFEFDKFWADEYAAWNRHTAQEVLDMLWFCLRESEEPQGIISTTPQPLPHVKVLVEEWREQTAAIEAGEVDKETGKPREELIRVTRGHTHDNKANLGGRALNRLGRRFDNTRQGKQELSGELLEDVEGALWSGAMFAWEGFRIPRIYVPPIDRLVVAVDPATTSEEGADENGFTVAARSFPFGKEHRDPRPRGYVLHSESFRATPYQTMRHAADLYHLWKADAVVLEANNGGEYLSTVLQMVDPTVNFRIVHASRGQGVGGGGANAKRARATPVAGLYEQARIHHVGEAKDFDALETVMTTYVGAKESVEKSPDILDSLVWALWDLFLDASAASGKRVQTSDQRLQGRR